MTTRSLIIATAIAATTASQAQQTEPPLRIRHDRPARNAEESLPIGNGKMSALVFGGADNDTILLYDAAMTTCRTAPDAGCTAAPDSIREARKSLQRADSQAVTALLSRAYGAATQHLRPLATLNITDNNQGPTASYARKLDTDSALCRDTYTRNGVTMTREYFASRPDRIVAIRLKASRRGSLNSTIRLSSPLPHTVKGSNGCQLTMTGHTNGAQDSIVRFCTILKANVQGGTTTTAGNALTISGATEAVVYVVNETSAEGATERAGNGGTQYIERAADNAWHTINYTYDEFRSRHVADWRALLGRERTGGGNAPAQRTGTEQEKGTAIPQAKQ